MTTSRASAVWEGKLRDGKGSFKAGSGAFGGSYSFRTRFEGAAGTNPEELLAAARPRRRGGVRPAGHLASCPPASAPRPQRRRPGGAPAPAGRARDGEG